MLKREQASQELQKFFSTPEIWLERHQTAIASLPDSLREIAWALLRRDRHGLYCQNWEELAKSANRLGEVNATERYQIFEALCPLIAKYVEAGWQLHQRLPYQNSYQRQPFRLSSSIIPATLVNWVQSILNIVQHYEQDIAWYAVWVAYIYQYTDIGILFAAAIEAEDEHSEEILKILLDSARGEHPIAAMGNHVVRSLLIVNRPDCWTFVENLLLAAQRQEGLRQTILEAIAQAHPQAFRRMVRLILEQDLIRFSATIRAVDQWFGFGWTVEQKKIAERSLRQLLGFLEDESLRQSGLESADPQEVYLCLWAIAFENAEAAIAPATLLLQHSQVEVRFVAAFLLNQLHLDSTKQALLPIFEDRDLRVAAQAFQGIQNSILNTIQIDSNRINNDLFERLEAFLQRIPANEKKLQPLVWEWMLLSLNRSQVIRTLNDHLGDRSPRRMIPYLSEMDVWLRVQVIQLLIKEQPWDDEVQGQVFAAMRDRSSHLREQIFNLLKPYALNSELIVKMEGLLTRKGSDLRRGVLNLILNQADNDVLISSDRLLNSKDAGQRISGLELLDEMIRAKRLSDDCYRKVEAYRQRPKLTAAEVELLQKFSEPEKQQTATLENGLGLFDPSQRTPAIPPEFPDREIVLVSEAAKNILRSLDDLIHEYRNVPVKLRGWDGTEGEEQLLGNLHWLSFPSPDISHEENLANLPLAEVWQEWWQNRSPELRDADGYELLRAIASLPRQGHENLFQDYSFFRNHFLNDQSPKWVRDCQRILVIEVQGLNYSSLVKCALKWLLFLYPLEGAVDFILDATQFSLATIHQTVLQSLGSSPEQYPDQYIDDWRENNQFTAWLLFAFQYHNSCPSEWTLAQTRRLWQLLRWIDEPFGTVPRYLKNEGNGSYQVLPISNQSEGQIKRCRPNLIQMIFAFKANAVTEADLLDFLVGERLENYYCFRELRTLTQRSGTLTADNRTRNEFSSLPEPDYQYLLELVDRCRSRIVEIECDRGDLPTPATEAALSLQSVLGIAPVIKLLQNLGKEQFIRGWSYDHASKAAVFSHLIRVSFPLPTDTPELFAQQFTASGLTNRKAIELAVYAPQWARYVGHLLESPAFAEAVWWFHAHTKDSHWQVEQSIREGWSAQVGEHTPLTSQDLVDGAVDVAWFWRAYRAMTPAQWEEIHEAAKFAAGGQGHTRARLFADAMLGQIEKSATIDRIQTKRHQDSVRALGLIPLESENREADILQRYEVIQEFMQGTKQFGSQRQASEKLAARIALENLSRTAGYADPQRLEWAMEAKAIADLVEGAVTVTEGDVSVSLSLDALGAPNLTIVKKGKPQKTIPATLKKNTEIMGLQERKQKLTKQASRMRLSLEQSMCRGDRFTGAELQQLLIHPILRPMLQQLIFVGETAIGYPQDSRLRKHDSTYIQLNSADLVRIAHPADLVKTGEWHLWQQECFHAERSQPFKQIFRELYLPIPTEETEQKGSRRYAGHQVNPRQALALFGQRGWVANSYDYESSIHRIFYDQDIYVSVETDSGWTTPAEVEGLTIDAVYFSQRSRNTSLKLDQVPAIVFSEVMRDLDLVVSVAHQGGVDPEASASTVEMRSALIRETNRLLKLTNVNLQNNYALIEGELGSYSVHLGSGVVHRQPGGSLCIVPVHSQHRGRLFLPFADDDPKTAEIISKILLLAKDKEIKDPTILQQLL
ncbi:MULTISPECIES: DUF4132 domain-containing protein [Pseudanabaena]|uniref:DUF4132 domain-containing protein n=2 Tax=Pseudanabaena TaxID=1152 RepID=L8MZ75_9CYAN|nr:MULTISPECIES: DUF4132 domain-containing protein [Pseudanabaena]ELS31283.1 hypothetical protein Pse7429DRAFT_3714 [Pseudanabaena biceps PCC 7429]MDG3496461.1 DUF5724 domain-containing protein [Pseudanabaena catenata USMAC16]